MRVVKKVLSPNRDSIRNIKNGCDWLWVQSACHSMLSLKMKILWPALYFSLSLFLQAVISHSHFHWLRWSKTWKTYLDFYDALSNLTWNLQVRRQGPYPLIYYPLIPSWWWWWRRRRWWWNDIIFSE